MSVALKVDGLRMEFGGLVAVKDVSFEVAKGEMVGLIAQVLELLLLEVVMLFHTF